MGPMCADIVERTQLAILSPNDKSAFAKQFESRVVANMRHICLVTDHMPRWKKNMFLFQLKVFVVIVNPRRQCVRETVI